MSQAVKLPDKLLEEARRFGSLNSRSVPKQIEYWSRIGKVAEENPDLPYSFIKRVLISKQEGDDGELTEYQID
jgi:ParD-like antitoxin of type II bacterial toxin-antitoxin system